MRCVLRAQQVLVEAGQRRLLDDINLEIGRGELVMLVGPNGAGKSTLLSTLSGDLTPQQGTVELFGQPLRELRPRRAARMRAVLEQHPRVGFGFLVREVVALGRTPWRNTDASEDDETVVAASMTVTDVLHLEGRDALTLSGGESARMSLARVFAQQTPVLFLDEPSAALDISHSEQLLGQLRALTRLGHTILVVSHDLDSAASWADRIILLSDGKIVADGAPADVLTAELLSDVYGTGIEVLRHPESGVPIVRPKRTGWSEPLGEMEALSSRTAPV